MGGAKEMQGGAWISMGGGWKDCKSSKYLYGTVYSYTFFILKTLHAQHLYGCCTLYCMILRGFFPSFG